MKRKRLLVFITLILVGAALLVWYCTPVGRLVSVAAGVAMGSDRTLKGEEADEAVAIVMKALSLSQGEDGFESWRLKTKFATLHQESGLISAEQPDITYFRREDGKPVYVTAKFGEINQEKSIMRLWDDVHVNTDDKTLLSSVLEYDDKKRLIVLPDPVRIRGTNFSGTAQRATVDLDANIITADGEISVEIDGNENGDERRGNIS